MIKAVVSMRSIRSFFLSKKTVLALISLILASVVIAYIFPQRISISIQEIDKWKEMHPSWGPWLDRLGLDHVYSTPWFAVLLLAFLISLALSTFEQVKIAIKKTFGYGLVSGSEKLISPGVSEGDVGSAVRRQGYLMVSSSLEGARFVKHPWGYWGNVLLHLGIVLVIASSLLLVLTERRGLLNFVEGEVHLPGNEWLAEDRGLLAERFILPEAVTLGKVISEFWETDDLKQLTTIISFIDPQGRFKTYTLAINKMVTFGGMDVYQRGSFGDAFFVEISDQKGHKSGHILQISRPARRDRAGYNNFRIKELPYLLKAKYFADKNKKSMISDNPLLVMRLVDGERVVSEISLRKGEAGHLGPYAVRLHRVSKWAGIVFVDIKGMPGIFLGFFVIILGGGLAYFTPPREILIKKEEDGISLAWKATRFESLYREEFERIKRAVEGEQQNG